MNEITIYIAAFSAAYLIGSLPFGMIVGKFAGLGDIRKQGSGNIGATNMLRAGGKKLALLTLAGDIGKGIVAVWVALLISNDPHIAYMASFIAIVGHCFPIWLGFKGGKGVATTVGAIIGYYHIVLALPVYIVILPLAAIWLLLFLTTRYVSLASIISGAALPVITFYFLGMWRIELAIAILIIVKHHENIRRLLKGEEHRFGKKKES